MRGARREARGEPTDDELFETMLLVILCLAVSTLMYIRNRWYERRRREEEERRGQQPDQQNAGGLFPPRGDPARREWEVLR